jgi:hypothetical protein
LNRLVPYKTREATPPSHTSDSDSGQ